MSRENDIRNAAWDYFQDLDSHHFHLLPHCNPQTDAFEAGAKWADKTIIEKACKWLKENINSEKIGRVMGEKKNALVQGIIDVACASGISRQEKEKAIANLIENHIEKPLLYAAAVWVCESFLEKDDDYYDRGKYLKGYFEDISEAVEDLRNEMKKAMEE